MNGRAFSVLCGTFLISFALLSFEITTIRTINFVVGPSYIYSAIALAMLGLSAAGAILSLVDIKAKSPSRDRILFWICVGIAMFLVFSQFLVTDIKGDINAALEAAGRQGGWAAVVKKLIFQSLSAAVMIGGLLLLPYFLFGALLSYLFVTTDRHAFGAVYAADLIGAAFGSISAIIVMETTSYAFSVTFPALLALLAAAAYGASCGRRFVAGALAATAVLAILPAAGWFERNIEPPADPNYLVRDYDYQKKATELWRGWNSFTRVGAVAVDDHGRMTLGNGEGNAMLPPHLENRPRPLRYSATMPALLLDPPKDSLVLFAGAGYDMISLREHGAGRVTGIEINRMLVESAMGLERFRIRELLSGDSSTLVISEARGFLERDTGKYDLVLLSYSGAPAAYYAGMLSGTVQYLYTYEGLTAVLNRLKPNGYAVIIHANKLHLLAALRRYLKAHDIGSPRRKAVLLFRPGDRIRAWNGRAEHNPLLIKPSGWSDQELARLLRNATTEGYGIAYAPGLPPHPDYTVYERILKADDFEKELALISRESRRRFDIKTDDRPFTYDLFLNASYFTWDFWAGPFVSKKPLVHELFRWIKVMFVLVIIVVALVLILAPLCILEGPTVTKRKYSHFGYFFCLGAGFIIIEIALMQKTSILFDTPGLTIAIVLASIILFAGLGSLISRWTFAKGFSLRKAAFGVLVYAFALYLSLDWSTHAMLSWPLFAKGAVVAAIIAPGALLMGHMFPQGLKIAAQDDLRLVPWAWGINGAMSTIGAGVAPLAAMAWGYNVLFLAGAVFYAATMILPTSRDARSQARSRPSW